MNWPEQFDRAVQLIGPLAGALIAFRLVLRFQRDVVDGATSRAAELEKRLAAAEQRIDLLQAEVEECDRRNALLVRTMIAAGIAVPPDTLSG